MEITDAQQHPGEMNGTSGSGNEMSQMDQSSQMQYPSGADQLPEAAEGDVSLACRDCGGTFLFTVGEQEFYSVKGFEGPPSRCKPCRAQKKLSRDNASNMMNYPMNYMMMDGYGMPYYGYGNGGPQPRKPCHAFQRGNCMYGADCRYSHDDGSGFPVGFNGGFPMGYGGMDQNFGGGYGGPPRRVGRPRNPCFAFQRGNCTYGDSCRYSHDVEVGAPLPGMGGGSKQFCHAFQQGDCKYGDTCRFVHEK